MALKKPATPGTFEDDSNVAIAEAPAAAPEVKQAEAVAKTAIVKAQQTSAVTVSAFGGVRPGQLFKDLKTSEPPFAFGTFPRFTGSGGTLSTLDAKQDLGDSVVIQLMSYNDFWMVTPGERSQETTELVKYSNDGVTLNESDVKVDDYLAKLKEDYTKASKKQYTSMWGIVLKQGAKGNCANLIGAIIEISLAPMSRKSLNAAEMQKHLDIARGRARLDYANILTINAENAASNGNKYTKLIVSSTPDSEAEALLAALAAPVST